MFLLSEAVARTTVGQVAANQPATWQQVERSPFITAPGAIRFKPALTNWTRVRHDAPGPELTWRAQVRAPRLVGVTDLRIAVRCRERAARSVLSMSAPRWAHRVGGAKT